MYNTYEAVGRVVELAPIIHRKHKTGRLEFYQYGILRYLSGRRICAIAFVSIGMRDIARCGFQIGAYGRLTFSINAKRYRDCWRNAVYALKFSHMSEVGYKSYLEELRKEHLYAPTRNWQIRIPSAKMLPPMQEMETYDDRHSLPF